MRSDYEKKPRMNDDSRVIIRFSAHEKALLEKIASEQETTVSNLIRTALKSNGVFNDVR
jgi:hypothetical protein